MQVICAVFTYSIAVSIIYIWYSTYSKCIVYTQKVSLAHTCISICVKYITQDHLVISVVHLQWCSKNCTFLNLIFFSKCNNYNLIAHNYVVALIESYLTKQIVKNWPRYNAGS